MHLVMALSAGKSIRQTWAGMLLYIHIIQAIKSAIVHMTRIRIFDAWHAAYNKTHCNTIGVAVVLSMCAQ